MGKTLAIMSTMRDITLQRSHKNLEQGDDIHQQELTHCTQGLMPERYRRNGSLTSPEQQAMLLRGRVLLVGLGGLGGHVLDSLARMGVGHITGVDGDIFEASNLNRQLLCTADTLGLPKAQVAAAHVARVNPATHFVPVARFVRGAELHELVRAAGADPGYDLVVDALGGLDDRAALHAAAQAAGIPVVTAGIAGLTGWVQVVLPQGQGPMSYFSQSSAARGGHRGTDSPPPSAEQVLGNLAPTVCVAAGLQCAQVYTILTGAQPATQMLVFDLQDVFFSTLAAAQD